MAPRWAFAFAAAFIIALCVTPLLRRLASQVDLVDHPSDRKRQVAPVPYLGGIALMAAVLAAFLLAPQIGLQAGGLLLCGAALGAMGLLDDDRTVHPGTRFGAEIAAAGLAVLIGLRIHATGVGPVDVAITMLWVVGITNAFNLLDNMDGLSAGVAAAAAGAIFGLAIAGEQPVAAALAASVIGACLGFLVYNRRPASIYMGDSGSLFLGFVVAVLAVDVNPALTPPSSFAIPVLLLALPVLDTSTVTLGRIRHGRSVFIGGTDHLSHRLVALGLSKGAGVGVLIVCQMALGGLAVFAGLKVIPLPAALIAAVLLVGTVTAVTSRASVYPEPADTV